MSQRIYNREAILSKLESLEIINVDYVIEEVSSLVEMNVLNIIFNRLSEETKLKLKEKTDSEVISYFKFNPQEIPIITPEEIFDIEDRTWSEYFKAIES